MRTPWAIASILLASLRTSTAVPSSSSFELVSRGTPEVPSNCPTPKTLTGRIRVELNHVTIGYMNRAGGTEVDVNTGFGVAPLLRANTIGSFILHFCDESINAQIECPNCVGRYVAIEGSSAKYLYGGDTPGSNTSSSDPVWVWRYKQSDSSLGISIDANTPATYACLLFTSGMNAQMPSYYKFVTTTSGSPGNICNLYFEQT